MQAFDDVLMTAYKTIRTYGTIKYDNSVNLTRIMHIMYNGQEYMVCLKNGNVESIQAM